MFGLSLLLYSSLLRGKRNLLLFAQITKIVVDSFCFLCYSVNVIIFSTTVVSGRTGMITSVISRFSCAIRFSRGHRACGAKPFHPILI